MSPEDILDNVREEIRAEVALAIDLARINERFRQDMRQIEDAEAADLERIRRAAP